MKLVETGGSPCTRLLVCLDLQRASLPDGVETERDTRRSIANCSRVLAHAREWDWSILHVHARHPGDGWRSRPIEGLEPWATEPVMTRAGLSAFANPSFRELLRGADRAQLILIGFSWSSSCLATVLSARDRGIAVTVVQDAMDDPQRSTGEADSLQGPAQILAAHFSRMVSTDEFIGRPPLRLVASR